MSLNFFRGAAASSFDPDLRALFDRMESVPDAVISSLISETFAKLKSRNIWRKLDSLQMYGGNTEQSALLDWCDASRTAVNEGMAFTPGGGFKGGTGLYLRTQFIPSTGPNFTLNDASFGVFVTSARSSGGNSYAGSLTATTSNTHLSEGSSGTGRFVSAWLSAGGTGVRVVVGDVLSGFMHAQRTSSTEIEAHYNELAPGTETNNSNTLSAAEMYIGALNNNGTAVNSIDAGFGAFWAGASLSALEIADLREILRHYFETIEAYHWEV